MVIENTLRGERMKIKDIQKIRDDKERAIQAALCPEIPEHIRCWFSLLAYAIAKQTLDKVE